MRSILAFHAAALLALLAACGPGDRGASGTGQGEDAGADPGAHERSGPGAEAVCLRGEPFVEVGALEVGSTGQGDARRVSALRWEAHEGCERLVVDLTGDDGEPAASAGEVRARLLRDLGVVRVELRGVAEVDPDATEAAFEGPLARAAYTVRAGDGQGIYIDVHLGAPAEARAFALGEPARLVIDLRPGGGAVPGAPPSDRRVVVLEPRPGRASYPLTVTGYARTFEANVVARLERGGEEVAETFTTSTGWLDAWGHYSLTFREGPASRLTLHVGEYSARDGEWEGVAVELDMR